jgi:hypothetical protein
MNKKGVLARLVGAFVVLMVGVSIAPVLVNQLQTVQSSINSTINVSPNSNASISLITMFSESGPIGGESWGGMLLKFVPAFFAVAILAAAVAMVMGGLKDSGIIWGGSNYEPTEEEIKIERKKRDKEEREREFIYTPNYKSPEYEYEAQSPGKPVMDETVYAEKKKSYDDKMKDFKNKKPLTEKELEKNL